MKRISLIVALLAVFTFAGQRVVVPKELRKHTEWGILLQGSSSCIKNCALIATNGEYGPDVPMSGNALACAKNQLPSHKIVSMKGKRSMIFYKKNTRTYTERKNAELTTNEYYELIGSTKVCEYREY